jgi:hypothetical protein
MPNHLLALVPAAALILPNLPRADTQPPASAAHPDVRSSGAIRTDRLSRKQLKAWNRIVKIVKTGGQDGQPLYPTLRRLWDAVDSSHHVIHVEMPDRKHSYIGGRFAITKVDPEGQTHEGIVIMNLQVIDQISTGSGAAHAGGFIPFNGLGRYERYAELLGHELAHAVWAFAAPERARLVMPLQSENETLMRQVLGLAPSSGDDVGERVSQLEQLSRLMEESAEAAEVAVWKELWAGQRRQ